MSGQISGSFKGRVAAFDIDASFSAPAAGVTGLFGPSGCGKTMLLRCAAGLERLSGKLTVDGDIWQDDASGVYLAAHKRPVGYVFQDANLFPHLPVRENLLFGAARAKKAGARTEFHFDDIVALTGLASLLDRAPHALSGGERQRVAIGRALLSQPQLLLFDEPLSALDAQAKAEIFPYLETLHATLPIPSLYVSHDMNELERLADSLVLMEKGRVVACGALADLQADPALPLIEAAEAAVTLDGTLAEIDLPYALASYSVAGASIIAPLAPGAIGDARRLRIKASDVSFALTRAESTSILNCLPARIVAIHDQDGPHANIVAALGEAGDSARIIGRVTKKSKDALGLEPGKPVFAQIKSVALAR